MTHATQVETERAAFETEAQRLGEIDFMRYPDDQGGDYMGEGVAKLHALWQAARRPPVAPVAQGAGRTLADEFSDCLKECRSAFQPPKTGTDLERLWLLALEDVTYVPEYIKAIAAAPQPPVVQKVFAFMHTSCIHESAATPMSLHTTKEAAWRAMHRHQFDAWVEAQKEGRIETRREIRKANPEYTEGWTRKGYGWRTAYLHEAAFIKEFEIIAEGRLEALLI